jgi:hypothetical protein
MSSPPPPAPAPSPPTSLWAQAVANVEGDDSIKEIFSAIVTPKKPDDSSLPAQDVAGKVMKKIDQRKAAMEKKQWSFKYRGRIVKIRDCFNVVVKAVLKFKDLGSALARLDPVHAGIPWACIMAVLEVRLPVFNFSFCSI